MVAREIACVIVCVIAYVIVCVITLCGSRVTACVMLSLRDSLNDRIRLKGAFVLSASPSSERIN